MTVYEGAYVVHPYLSVLYKTHMRKAEIFPWDFSYGDLNSFTHSYQISYGRPWSYWRRTFTHGLPPSIFGGEVRMRSIGGVEGGENTLEIVKSATRS